MNAEDWDADIYITEATVKNCLQEQFPSLSPIKEIKYIGEGWDNKVFLVNQEFIFRFPRRKVAVKLIEKENKILNNLPSFSSIEIPAPQYIGHLSSHFPYPFQGYKLIKGVPGYHAQLNEEHRIASLVTLSIFLKQLHSIDETQAIAMGAEIEVFDRTFVNESVDTLNERVEKIIAQKILGINKDRFQQEIATVQQLSLPSQDNCLVHNDLDCRHLIFDKNQLKGIIDWGDVGITHKSVDLAVIWSFYPQHCHEYFFQLYGDIDLITWQYARFLGLYSAFTLLLYGKNTGDKLLVSESIASIHRINENLIV